MSDAEPAIELSVVMPVYNEQEALPDVLEETLSTLAASSYRFEIVLVDDASKDRSPQILEEFRGRHPDVVRVLRHEKNKGIMGAFQTLYENARGEFVFLNGSDGQWKTSEALRMMDCRDRYDIVVGRRFDKKYDWRRRVVSSAFNVLPLLMFGVRTYDAGSIKLFRRDVLSIPLISEGPFREAERLIRASDAGLRIGVIDVEHFNRHGGVASGARFRLIRQSLADLWRCWWALRVRRRGGRTSSRGE